MTEITELKGVWLFYDGNCRFCVETLRRVQPLLARRTVHTAPLQTDWVQAQLGLDDTNLLAEMKLLNPAKRVHGGADAFVALARLYWWAWPFYLLAHLPGVKPLLRWGYKRLAAKRYCISGTCELPRERVKKRIPTLVWLTAVLFPLVTLPFKDFLPAWGFMWLFHPPFINKVILPMLQAFGTTGTPL